MRSGPLLIEAGQDDERQKLEEAYNHFLKRVDYHLSSDEALLEAFKDNDDKHFPRSTTATKLRDRLNKLDEKANSVSDIFNDSRFDSAAPRIFDMTEDELNALGVTRSLRYQLAAVDMAAYANLNMHLVLNDESSPLLFQSDQSGLAIAQQNEHRKILHYLIMLKFIEYAKKPEERQSINNAELASDAAQKFLGFQAYIKACNELDEATSVDKSNPDTSLKKAGRKVLAQAQRVKREGRVLPQDLPALTASVEATTKFIKNPQNQLDNYATSIEKASKFEWSKMLAPAMVGLLGVGLIVVSSFTLVATFGASAPLSAAGIAIGISAISMMAGGATALVGSMLFANSARKGDMRLAMEDVMEEKRKFEI